MRTRAEIVARARFYVGHRETSKNDSSLIRVWLRRCGIRYPAPWCAAFASWCVSERDADPSPLVLDEVDVESAGALKLAALFPETRDPQQGDLMFFATGGGKGHVGIVFEVGETDVLCIEGNSADRVRYVRRLRSEVRFARTRDEQAEEPDLPSPAWLTAPVVHVSVEGTR